MISEISVKDIHEAARSGSDLYTLAPILRRVVSHTSGEAFDQEALMRIIHSDTALSVRLLRAANKDYGGTVKNLDKAAARIGSQTLRSITLSSSFIDDNMGIESQHNVYHALQQVWERTLYLAVGARLFAIELEKKNHQDYLMIGILLHIGIQFLLSQFPDRYLPVLDEWMVDGGDLIHYERATIGVDHAVVGHHLARTWKLGENIEKHIRHQYTVNNKKPGYIDSNILYMANLAAGVFFEARNSSGIARVNDFAKMKFDLSSRDLALLIQRIALEADSISEEMISGSSAVNTVELLQSINQELGRATLSYDQLVRELKAAMSKAETLARKLENANRKLRDAANIDPLTRIYNRRFFQEFLAWNFERTSRYNSTLGCLMIDIDHFKRVNDEHDHLTGDRVLHEVAQTLKSHLRSTDLIARYGGEEFLVMLPESSLESVQTTALKLLKAVSHKPFQIEDGEICITVSIGYIAFNKEVFPDIDSQEQLIKIADQNMYLAKSNGRNQIWPAPDVQDAEKSDNEEQPVDNSLTNQKPDNL